jgi:MFS family permease
VTTYRRQEVRGGAKAPPGPGGGIMRNHDFIRLWAGESISLIGNQITVFALPLAAILTLHASIFQVGLLNMSRNIPIVCSLFAGVWLDRRRRRPILIACSLGNAILVGLVPLSAALGFLSMGLLYVVTLLMGVLSAVFDVGVLTYIPYLVGREHLAASNSRIQASTSFASVAGPGIAGLLVGIFTAPVTLTADAVSYLCSAVGVITICRREPEPEKPGVGQTVRRSISEGLHSVYGSALLRSLLGMSGAFNFVQAGFITIFVVYAVRNLGMSPLQLGLVLGATAVGGTAGAGFANRITKIFGVGPTMLVSLGGATLCPLLLLIPRDSSPWSLSMMCAIQFIHGFGVLTFNVNTVTLRQVVTADRLLGRMNASYRLVLMGTAPPGAFLGGVLGQSFGLHTALLIAVVAFLSPILWTLFSPVIKVKEMPEGPLEDGREL